MRLARWVFVFACCHCGSSSTPSTAAPTATAPKHFLGLAQTRWVESLAYADGQQTLWVASEDQVGGADGESRAFATTDGSTKTTVAGPTWSVASNNGSIALGGNTDTLVDPKSGQVVRTLAGASGAVAFSPDGKWVAAAAPTTNQVIIYSTTDGSVVAQVAHPLVTHERIWRVAFSPDGSVLATASGQTGLGSPHGSTFLWRTKDWSPASTVTCTTFDAAFSPDGHQLALACWLDVRILSAQDFSLIRTLPVISGTLAMSVAWSPDSKKIAVGGLSAGVQVFQAADGTAVGALTEGTSHPTIKGLAWSPDGQWIAGGGWDDAIVRIWPAP
jgi:WD40 repeat protein